MTAPVEWCKCPQSTPRSSTSLRCKCLRKCRFSELPEVVPFISCRVCAVKYMANPKTDEVFAKMRLVLMNANEPDFEDDGIGGINGSEGQEKPAFFATTLTQLNANNGGGLSVPRYCAETIFPRLDYLADPPLDNLFMARTL
ncbi:auxin response factor 18-like [Juglans microcarpa x Juglans regia]|uniref:auxin response factor 18-like n=1 Tax=Juglans microcarpa x Juglans regia TaxID=2249226 RepID=UPI001B7E803F|nr:auxin response factor 18-like [Juglans microcarpa x Juglans regia]